MPNTTRVDAAAAAAAAAAPELLTPQRATKSPRTTNTPNAYVISRDKNHFQYVRVFCTRISSFTIRDIP